MGSRTQIDDGFVVAPFFYDHPDDLEPAHMPLKEPENWTPELEAIRVKILSAATLPRAQLYKLVFEIVKMVRGLHNPEFVRK